MTARAAAVGGGRSGGLLAVQPLVGSVGLGAHIGRLWRGVRRLWLLAAVVMLLAVAMLLLLVVLLLLLLVVLLLVERQLTGGVLHWRGKPRRCLVAPSSPLWK